MDEKHINSSVNQTIWRLPDVDFDVIARIVRRYDLPEPVARIIAARGVLLDDIPEFLNPTLRDHFPDPFSMAGMQAMAEDIAQDIMAEKTMAIFADFDVDGATSAAVLYRFLKHVGCTPDIYIPERRTEGYGPNVQAFQKLHAAGADVLFVLDCGTTAFDVMKAGTDLGLKIVIVDHHEPEDHLPEAAHVINPKRTDDGAGLDMLAAVGVTFMVCVAVNATLKKHGFYSDRQLPYGGARPAREEPSLKALLDLVALGTVCDMVPLTGPNRLFVKHGFPMMMHTDNEGLQALTRVSGLSGEITPYHAGFVLGPRINAGSRVHRSDLGAKLLSTSDTKKADELAWMLNDANDKRKALQAEMEREALQQVEAQKRDDDPAIVVHGADWHTGLSGLVAGRLKDRYKKPVCVIADVKMGDGTVEGRGSGRSVPGVHIAEAFIAAKDAELLLKGGGHAMAGGFTIAPDKIEAFRDFMNAYVQDHGADERSWEQHFDGLLSVRGVQADFVRQLANTIGPFGQENPEPVFCFENVRLWSLDVVGEAHIRAMISDWEGGPRIKAMAFRAVGTPVGDALLQNKTRAFDVWGALKVDNWGGHDRAEIHIRDVRFSGRQCSGVEGEDHYDTGT